MELYLLVLLIILVALLNDTIAEYTHIEALLTLFLILCIFIAFVFFQSFIAAILIVFEYWKLYVLHVFGCDVVDGLVQIVMIEVPIDYVI